MSAMNVWAFTDTWGRGAGPEAAAVNLENLGWLHRSRVWTGWPRAEQTLTGWDAGLPGRRVLLHTRNAENGPDILGGGWQPAGALGGDLDDELRLDENDGQLARRRPGPTRRELSRPWMRRCGQAEQHREFALLPTAKLAGSAGDDQRAA